MSELVLVKPMRLRAASWIWCISVREAAERSAFGGKQLPLEEKGLEGESGEREREGTVKLRCGGLDSRMG